MYKSAVIILILLLVPLVSANEFEFEYRGDDDHYVGARLGGEYFGMSFYQTLFVLGYAMVVFGVFMQGLSKIAHFNKRISVGMALGLMLMSLVPVLPWVAKQDFRVAFSGSSSFGVFGLLLIGLATAYFVFTAIMREKKD